MSNEIIWRLTEPERKALMTEIHALNNNDKALAIDFIKELLRSRKPTDVDFLEKGE
jgi:hypothetical protein